MDRGKGQASYCIVSIFTWGLREETSRREGVTICREMLQCTEQRMHEASVGIEHAIKSRWELGLWDWKDVVCWEERCTLVSGKEDELATQEGGLW